MSDTDSSLGSEDYENMEDMGMEPSFTVMPIVLSPKDEEPFDIELEEGDMVALHNVAIVVPEGAKDPQGVSRLYVSSRNAGTKLLLCTLRAGKTESVTLETKFCGPEEAKFTVEGDYEVHIFATASFMEIDEDDFEDMAEEAEDDDEEMEDEDEDDEEMNPEELKKLEQDIQKQIQKHKKGNDELIAKLEKKNQEGESKKPKAEEQKKKGEEQQPKKKAEEQPKKAEEQPKKKAEEQPKKDNKKRDQPEDAKESSQGSDAKKAKPAKRMLKGGVAVTDVVDGSGKEAQAGKKVAVKYTGRLPEKGGKVFDSGSIKFKIGAGEVIKGWEIGVAGMKVGGKRTIVCPPAVAYGASGSGPIPPNATLEFDVELTDVL